jgi:hypothetical protein
MGGGNEPEKKSGDYERKHLHIEEIFMATQILIVRDVRLEGSRPRGNEVLEVDENTPISWPISWILNRAKFYNSNYVWLKILAHGFEAPLTSGLPMATGTNTTVQEWQGGFSQGGDGIQFCKEGLNLWTIGQFKKLFEWLDWTDIYSCGTAYITPGQQGGPGDGNLLCSNLARILGCPVRASTATQYYDKNGSEFGKWEGTVLTYGPKGNVIKVEQSPAT